MKSHGRFAPRRLACAALLLFLAATHDSRAQISTAVRPNVLLLVADDLGYADLGSYGSDIRTPNIDALADEGIRFTQFHTASLCSPTRAMLLSGNNNHVAGVARQHGGQGLLAKLPGYEGHLSDRILPFPKLLRDAGYHTFMAGKWHLGTAEEHSPVAAGFERSFVLTQGAGSHFSSLGMEEGGSIYREDGKEVDYPDGAYSTEVYTDRLIEYIEANRQDGQPFFAFAAYTSPHWPLQVPDDELDRYAGVYDEGYDALRIRRFESLRDAGIVAADAVLPPRNPEVTPWTELSPEEQRREAREMELYAAMVENLDGHVGRLVGYLKANGLYENTLIVFMSDNGAAAEDFYDDSRFRDYLQRHYDNAYENMGRPLSWVSYDAPWAEAGSAPFARHKGYARQGGIVAPLIVSGAGVERPSEIDRSYVTVMDLAPTFLELAGAVYPIDGSVAPMLGESMVEFLAGTAASVHDDDYVTAFFHTGRAYLRQGPWKLVTLDPPFDESDFKLFNVETDPGETSDLSASAPERYEAMLDLWRTHRRELGIVLPSDL